MSDHSLYTELSGTRTYRILELYHGSRSVSNRTFDAKFRTKGLQDPLQGKLFQCATLDRSFIYEALSYRWSDAGPNSPSIKVDDVQLSIGPELYAALIQFRHEAVSRYLWIDQICINQADDKEKIHQISLMAELYSRAQTVLIWLGEASDQSDLAMEFFPIFVELAQRDDGRSRSLQSSQAPSGIIPWRGALATSLRNLLSRSWFGRVWTLQEAAMARDAQIWCGQKSFSFRCLEIFERGCNADQFGHWDNALRSIGGSKSGRPDPENPEWSFNHHVRIVSTLREASGVSSARILNSLRVLECSQHQDRIYAVLRFLEPELVEEVVRRQLLSEAKLYHFVAMYEIQRGQWEYLGAAGLSQHRISYPETTGDSVRPRLELPSWVPDWTYNVRGHSCWVHNSDRLLKRGNPLYTAGLRQFNKGDWSVSDDEQFLHGTGIIIDEVSECAEPFRIMRMPENLENTRNKLSTATTLYKSIQSYIITCADLAAKCTSCYGSEHAGKACRLLLVGGLVPDGSNTMMSGVLKRASDEEVDSLFEEFQKVTSIFDELIALSERFQSGTAKSMADLHQMIEITSKAQDTASFSMKNNLIQAMAEACKGRRFFITGKDCWMGVAPDITQPGDKICVIPGTCAPYVIRPVEYRYQLIGECYVAGMMDGEMMWKEVSLEPLVFV